MKAFEVYVNGRYLVTAGVGLNGVLNAHVLWTGDESSAPGNSVLRLRVGGLDSSTDEHVRWPVPSIGVGDEITIRVVEADRVSETDIPRTPVDREDD